MLRYQNLPHTFPSYRTLLHEWLNQAVFFVPIGP